MRQGMAILEDIVASVLIFIMIGGLDRKIEGLCSHDVDSAWLE